MTTWIVRAREPNGKIHSLSMDELSQLVAYVEDQRRRGREVWVEDTNRRHLTAGNARKASTGAAT
jgi:hypothetical protein